MSTRELPAHPNLEHLKNQARTLLDQYLVSDAASKIRFSTFAITAASPKLADALHVIAREYGFETWPALKLHVEALSPDPLAALTAALKAGSARAVRDVLHRHPSLKSRLNQPLPDYGFDSPPLVAAVQKENREIVDLLLDAGADINQRTLWWAGGFGVLDFPTPAFSRYLISRGAQVDIHSAARLGMVDRVRQFLAADPSLVHARGGDGQFPLHFAATVEIATLLLDHGAEIDARDIDHESTAAQYMACSPQTTDSQKSYRHDVARFLVARGAHADILMASALGDLSLVERILNHDPETIRTTVNDRYFPKRDPKSGGSIYLYGFGFSKSPHMIAHQFGHAAVFDLLMQRSAPWLRLIQAAELADQPLVDEIIRQHPSLFDRLSPNASRRIIGATVRNNTRAVQILLDTGWPAHAALDNNQTALHYAAWHGNLAMVNALLSHHAPVNAVETEHGGSPLGWALHGSLNSWERAKGDYPGVTRALLAAGAAIPNPDRPLEATDEVLEIIRHHAP